eukprot:gene19173-21094_t
MDKLEKLVFLSLLFLQTIWPTQQTLGKSSISNKNLKRNANKRLCFSIFGDFGGSPKPPYTTWQQKKVAAEMAKAMQDMDCRFIVGLGDNFYFSGVKNVHDPRFQHTFEDVYNKKFHYVPWYVIAGNHDHLSNVSAQIAYSKVSSRWKFPHFFHSKVHQIPNTDKTVHVILIDTSYLIQACGKSRIKNGPLVNGQLRWIENELKSSKSDYIIVGGHHPVLSAGSHGNNPCLLAKLRPMMEKHGVTAYFSGHDHNLQHIKDPKSSVNYFVSGSGNFFNGWSNNRGKLPQGSLKFFEGEIGGFAVADLSRDDMTLKFFSDQGRDIYTTQIRPRQTQTSKNLTKRENSVEIVKNFFTMYQSGNVSSDFWKFFSPVRLRRG